MLDGNADVRGIRVRVKKLGCVGGKVNLRGWCYREIARGWSENWMIE